MTGASHGATGGVAGHAEGWRSGAGVLARPREALALLRLTAGGTALFGVVLFVFGTSWDIQWHSFIGRDRALVPPHLLMLGGITLCGVAALSAVGVESFWARSTPAVARLGTPFAGAFSASLGAYLAGFAALAAAVGFPLDVYWHSLYGIDVSVWAPFHVMIISGMSIAALGVAHLLLSGANLADGTALARATRAARIGALVAIAGMLCALMFFLDAAFDDAAITIGPLTVDTYSLMVGGFGGFALALAVAAWPARFTALGVAAAYYAFDLVVFLVVPPLTEALRVAEHQVYKDGGRPTLVVVSWLMPATLIIGAAAIGYAANRARRLQLPAAALRARVGRAAVVGLLLTVVLHPIYLLITIGNLSNGPGWLLGLLLGAAGAWLGSRLGLEVGQSLRQVER
jgi:hypothetical protein